jgi:hypothetical protein
VDDFFQTRYDGVHNGGLPKLQAGNFNPWVGLPAADRRNPVVAARIKVVGEVARVINLVATIADLNQVKVSLAGRDFPLHVTLKLSKADMPAGYQDPAELASGLVGQSFMFGHLAVTPNMILGSDTGPARVAEVRKKLDAAFAAQGLVPEPLDIFHATIARVMTFDGISGLEGYATALLTLRTQLAAKPIPLVVHSIFGGTVEELLEEKIKTSV